MTDSITLTGRGLEFLKRFIGHELARCEDQKLYACFELQQLLYELQCDHEGFFNSLSEAWPIPVRQAVDQEIIGGEFGGRT